jgi:5'-phosphate synthase pdxT subunit
MKRIGVLALQGGSAEHVYALGEAAKKLKMTVEVCEVRKKEDLADLDGIVLPGGESTAQGKLIEDAGMADGIRKIRKIFGTCAGLILLARAIESGFEETSHLGLLDVSLHRNTFGSQVRASFETKLETTKFGTLDVIFIRPPTILDVGKSVSVLAKFERMPAAVYQKRGSQHLLATTFHPELTTTKFHEYFLKL